MKCVEKDCVCFAPPPPSIGFFSTLSKSTREKHLIIVEKGKKIAWNRVQFIFFFKKWKMSLMSVRNYQYLAEIPSLKNSLWTYFRFFLGSSFFVDFIVVLYIFHIFFFRSLSLSQFNVLFYFDVPWQQKVCCASLIRVAFSTGKILKQKNLTRTAFHVRNDININVILSFSRHGFFVGPICAHFSEFPSVVFVGFWELWRPSRNFTCTTVKLEFL